MYIYSCNLAHIYLFFNVILFFSQELPLNFRLVMAAFSSILEVPQVPQAGSRAAGGVAWPKTSKQKPASGGRNMRG